MTEIARKKEKGFAAFADKLIEKLMGLVYFEYNGHQLFYAGFFLYYLGRAIATVYWPGMSSDYHFFFSLTLKIIRYFAYILCFAQIILNDFREKHFIRLFTALSIIGVQIVLSGKSEYATMAIVFLAAYDSDPKKIIKTSFVIKTIFIFSNLLLSVTGLTWDYVHGNGLFTKVHYLGFQSVSASSFMSLFWGLEYLYLKRGFSFLDGLFVLALNETTAVLTDTNTTMILAPLVVISGLLVRYWKYWRKPGRYVRALFIISPFLFCAAAVCTYGSFNKDSEFWQNLNKVVFHGRLTWAKEAIDKYSLTLLGSHVDFVGYGIENIHTIHSVYTYNYVDSSYINVMVSYGIIFTLILLSGVAYIMYKSYLINDKALSVVIFWMGFMSLTEPFLFNPAFNVFIYLVFCNFKERKDKRRFYF